MPWENHNTALHDDMMLIETIRPGGDIKHRCPADVDADSNNSYDDDVDEGEDMEDRK